MRWLNFLVWLCLGLFVTIQMFNAVMGETSPTGKIISGEVTQTFSASVLIDADPPDLKIIFPENKTYNDVSLSLNYTIFDAVPISRVWYNLDKGENITLNGNITITVSEGSHTLFLYANDSFSYVNQTNVTFYVSLGSGWIISTNKYFYNSTNFTYVASQGKSYMQNMSNFTLEIADYGKIIFNDFINISRNVDIDEHTDIRQSVIVINSTNMPELNHNATIYLRGINFSNPVILRNGQECPSSICVQKSYMGTTFIFNVTSFSINYSVIEKIPEPEPSGGGGGAREEEEKEIIPSAITLIPKTMTVTATPGETISKELIIVNNLNMELEVVIELSEISEYLSSDEKTISYKLSPKENKVIPFKFEIPSSEAVGIKFKKIKVKSSFGENDFYLIFEIEEAPLLDLSAKIPPKYKVLSSGKKLLAEIKAFNFRESPSTEVLFNYYIKNDNDEIIYQSYEKRTVEKEIFFNKEIRLSRDTSPGVYVFYTTAEYGGKIAVASDTFEVVEKKCYIWWIIFILIFILLLIILVLIKRRRDEEKEKKKRKL